MTIQEGCRRRRTWRALMPIERTECDRASDLPKSLFGTAVAYWIDAQKQTAGAKAGGRGCCFPERYLATLLTVALVIALLAALLTALVVLPCIAALVVEP